MSSSEEEDDTFFDLAKKKLSWGSPGEALPPSPPQGGGGGGAAARPAGSASAPAPPAALPAMAAAAAEDNDAIKVYLRIRPLTSDEKAANDQAPFLGLSDAIPNEVTVVPPADSKKHKGSNDPASYSFTEICRQQTSQEQVFQKTTLPMVGNVLEGKNGLLFTYGVTNSGKTYTVQGTSEQPGLVPRSLDVLFNSIESQREGHARVQPYCFDGTKDVGPSDRIHVAELKADCIAAHKKLKKGGSQPELNAAAIAAAIQAGAAASAADGESNRKSNGDGDGDGDNTMDEDEDAIELDELASAARLRDQTKLPVSMKHKYLVYVSFVEIYNEFVYDLLVPLSSKKARRATCKLGETKAGDVFIRGTREINVTSSTEALEVMAMGQRNRQMGATASNKESSRSHCLFTIKLIKLDASGYGKTAVSQMTIVDLAGSERSDKTDAKGQRLKEAGNINASLMHLGKCLDAIKWNQQQKKGRNQRLIPYRDSKLTRIFKNYFEGKGSGTIRMVVNISEVSDAFDETSHVLRFSAIARQVSTVAATSKINTGITKLRSEIEESLTSEILDLEDYNIGLLEKLAALQQQLHEVELKSSRMEIKIREEVMEEMAEQMEEMEKGFEIAASQRNNATESKYEKKWEAYTHSVARLPARSRVPAASAAAPPPGVDYSAELTAAVAAAATATAATESATAALSALTTEHGLLQLEIGEMLRNNEILESDLDVAEEERSKADEAGRKAAEEHAEELQILEQTANATSENHRQALEALAQGMREAHTAEMQDLVAKSDEMRNKYESQAAAADTSSLVAPLKIRCEQLELELDEADANLLARPTAEAFGAVEKDRDTALAQLDKLEQRHRFDVSKRDRKIRAHEDTIETVSQSCAVLKEKNGALQKQIAAMLQNNMDDDVVTYGKSKAGSALSRAGSVVYNKGSVPTTAAASASASASAPAATKRASSRNRLQVPGVADAGSAAATVAAAATAALAAPEHNDANQRPKPKRSTRSGGRKESSAGETTQTTHEAKASVVAVEVTGEEEEPVKPKRRTRSNGAQKDQKKAASKTRATRKSRSGATAAKEALAEVAAATAADEENPVRRSRRNTRGGSDRSNRSNRNKGSLDAEDAATMADDIQRFVDADAIARVQTASQAATPATGVAPSSLMVWSPDPDTDPETAAPSPKRKADGAAPGSPELQGKENDADADIDAAAAAATAAAAKKPATSTRKKRKLYKKGVLSPLGDAAALDVVSTSSGMFGRFVDAVTPRRLRPRRKGTSA